MNSMPNDTTSPPLRATAWNPLVVAGAALLVLWLILLRLVSYQWIIFEDHGYGWSVPFLSLYLLWLRLQPLPVMSGVHQPDSTGSTKTLVILGAILALLLLPLRWVQEANLLWRPTLWLSILSGIGITVCLLRLAGGRELVVRAAFPLAFLLVAVPLPTAIETPLTQSFMRANAATVGEMLVLAGIPALRSGNTLDTGNGVVGVDDACSGIRSFQACLMLALFFGELHRLSVARRMALLFAGVACSFVFNLGRTTLLTVVAWREGTEAVGRWHDPAGVGILVGCFTTLLLLSLWLKKGMAPVATPSAGETMGSSRAEDAFSPSGLAPRVPPMKDLAGGSENAVPRFLPGSPNALRLCSVGLIGWCALMEFVVEGWYRWHEQRVPHTFTWSTQAPAHALHYLEQPLEPMVTNLMRQDQGYKATWRDDRGATWQMFFLRWDRAKTARRRAELESGRTHNPEICMTAAGFRMERLLGTTAYQRQDLRLVFDRYQFDWNGEPVFVFFTIDDPLTGAVGAYRLSSPQKRLRRAWSGSRSLGQTVIELAVVGFRDADEAESAFQIALDSVIVKHNPRP